MLNIPDIQEKTNTPDPSNRAVPDSLFTSLVAEPAPTWTNAGDIFLISLVVGLLEIKGSETGTGMSAAMNFRDERDDAAMAKTMK